MSTIQYSRQGSGAPVVLIHGIGHRRQAWGDIPERLATSYDVIAIDLPGFGESPRPTKPGSYAMTSVVDQIVELFTELGIDRPHVVGNSLGGYYALELARRDVVASATALSPAGFWSWPELYGVAGVQLAVMKASTYAPGPVLKLFADNGTLRKISMRALYSHPERLTPEAALGDSYNLRRSKAFWPTFFRAVRLKWHGEEPPTPVTVAWGDTDRLLIPRQATRAAERLPSAAHVTLVDCGHVPMIDDPDQVERVVREQVEAASRTRLRPVADAS
ncbi:alpha/beta fold hydrolase [Luteipulveratus mongoliensis]|uniref:AB hydrolase-1 domain-containing protein n=1 Tax=Luteipulveratus mongoliensis TaxID=571913 RepID=A0A0K1JNH2_9MICO|nr:alpha/beta hydrolase [Luteipulveratus mongoliensis]AKU18257.1 hypothetical protein VV02_24395 [Luteipulveratus mongoliensis]